jgi:Phage derived protein Gp49-like (DUF891)
MKLWTFKSYLDANGCDVMTEWYDELPPKAQARFDKILEHFRDSVLTDWGSNYFKQLHGSEGIYEVRFTVNNIVYRPLGCFAPFQGEFTFLIGAKEQGDEFIPRTALDTAKKRRTNLLKDLWRANECSF